MNICRSPTFSQSFHVEEHEETRLLYVVCCVCVDFCKHFLRKPRSSNNLALPGFTNLKFESYINQLHLFHIHPKNRPKLDMIFCQEFLLLATEGPRQHGHCGRPRSVAQDFSCFWFPDLHTHTHTSRRASCRAVPCKCERVPLATKITKQNERIVVTERNGSEFFTNCSPPFHLERPKTKSP